MIWKVSQINKSIVSYLMSKLKIIGIFNSFKIPFRSCMVFFPTLAITSYVGHDFVPKKATFGFGYKIQ